MRCSLRTLQLGRTITELLMGLEPMTSSLPRKCSTTELQQRIAQASPVLKNRFDSAERVKGIEPSPPAWKAGALPLSYTRCSISVTADRSYRQADRIPKSTSSPMTTSQKIQKTGSFSGLALRLPGFGRAKIQLVIDPIKKEKKWGEQDSNLRRQSQQIYSLSRLTASVPPQIKF